MRWFETVANIAAFFGRYYLIHDRENKQPYLHRYYLLSTRWLEPWFPKLSYRLVLHRCVLSDADGLHDHPWDWKSKILSGGYWEIVPKLSVADLDFEISTETMKLWRDPKDGWRSRKAHDYHRLELPHEGAECWSLFLMGPRTKDWGFKDKNGQWVQWEEYINNRDQYV